jgi:hypothetical protein
LNVSFCACSLKAGSEYRKTSSPIWWTKGVAKERNAMLVPEQSCSNCWTSGERLSRASETRLEISMMSNELAGSD